MHEMEPNHIAPWVAWPVLKRSCDSALQGAFEERNWPIVISLAKQRYKSTKDPYYLAIEVAGRSQCDNASDKTAGRDAVLKLVADSSTIVKDVDALGLYEFSCYGAKLSYSETIGVLRSRLVKAKPKDWSSSSQCLMACIFNSDWLHAQEITASMEKNFPAEKRCRIQNIFTTHMYSQTPACPVGSRELLAKLAKLRGDKEFESRGLSKTSDDHSAPLSLTASEAWLWIELQSGPQTPLTDKIAAFQKHALRLLGSGLNNTFVEILLALENLKAWGSVSEICGQVVEKAIDVSQREASLVEKKRAEILQHRRTQKEISEKKQGEGDTGPAQNPAGTSGQNLSDNKGSLAAKDSEDQAKLEAYKAVRGQRSDQDKAYLMLAMDPLVWNSLINSASEKENYSQTLKQLRKSLDRLMKALARSGEAKDLDQSRYDRVHLRILFLRDAQSAPEPEATSSTRVEHLLEYILKYHRSVSCFEDVRKFVEALNPEELQMFVQKLGREALKEGENKDGDKYKSLTLVAILLQIRFLVATSTGDSTVCKYCRSKLDNSGCISCFTSIVKVALENYNAGMRDDNLRYNVLPKTNGDPLSDLAVVGSISLLNLARVGRSPGYTACSPLHLADIQYVLQATIWLDSYLTAWPKNNPLRMLLLKLYLLIGCVSQAKSLWAQFDIKNAILDSLGPLFFDRISTIAPGLFGPGASIRHNPLRPFIDYYSKALRGTIPKQTVEAFKGGNWHTIPSMYEFGEGLKKSCTLVMAVVEERRGLRFKAGHALTSIADDPLVCNLNPDHELKDMTDYSYLPNFGSKDSMPTEALVSQGPMLSSTRAHLSLLTERLVDLIDYAQPKDFKPSKQGHVLLLDCEYVVETTEALRLQMQGLLAKREGLTGPEVHYYSIASMIAKLVSDFFQLYVSHTPTSEGGASIDSSIKEVLSVLEEQTTDLLMVPANYHSELRAFHGFVGMHAMGALRESVFLIKLTVGYLTTALDKTKTSGRALTNDNETSRAVGQLKSMSAAASASAAEIKSRIKTMKQLVEGGGWIDRLRDWAFTDHAQHDPQGEDRELIAEALNAAVDDAAFERWAGTVVDSWQELMNGWSAVKIG
ncbi:hypothetical protein DL766_010174 [Monosporascus sp. MC13-8B]|uniref:Uncharacterized protein n=1 Tax=Monosporascus cannonballus TaxID=155416 RepID=A0ABY0GTV0_9PEZI|nr:hypothetical protein DL762_009507 [Monosporascus cannonballus]RYO78634.1 hypothetical protein DL763_009564 [Monosporascus cannonballus]RYP08675.1 hypothetical protein DL766_010174 [Monosporascus sp. MC13-8B]